MNVSVDGFVAGPNDDVSFISTDSWKNYSKTVSKFDAVIIGHKTYYLMPKAEFYPEQQYVVIAHGSPKIKRASNVVFWHGSAKLLLKELQESGAKNVLIAGGGQTNSLFLNEKLVDELIVDVEASVLGWGTKLFSRLVKKVELKLLSVKKMGKNTVRLHYAVGD